MSFSYRCFRSAHASSEARDYASLVNFCIYGGDGANLLVVDSAHLITTNSVVSVATDVQTGAVISGAHAVIDGLGEIWLQGVATDPAYRRLGVGRTVFANAIVHASAAFRSTDYRLSVRERNGVPAAEAFSLYNSFSFRTVARWRVDISGSEIDAHQRDFAEGEKKDHFFALKMSADIDALYIARAHLLKRLGGAA